MPTYGFENTITEAQWAQAHFLSGGRGKIYGGTAWKVSAAANQRRVTVAPGTGGAAGIVHVATTTSVVDIPTPAVARWHLIVARYVWATKSVTFATVPWDNTGGVSYRVAPRLFPALKLEPGVEYEQPLAAIWVTAATTALEVYDLRIGMDGRPAELGVETWKYERDGNGEDRMDLNFDPKTSVAVSKIFPLMPRGNLRVNINAILKTTQAGGAAGRMRILMNGNTRNEDSPYLFKTEWDPFFWSGGYYHPGGDFTVILQTSAAQSRVLSQGTFIEVDWMHR